MKAIVYHRYGSPDVLQLSEVAKPIQRDDEVLIKVHASSINSWDWDLLRGAPFVVRLGGFLKPKYKILGADIAGRVEAVGKNVKMFKPGDDVFGDLSGCGWGGFAEYVCAHENALASKPASITFAAAAAAPQAALMALQGLRDVGRIARGQKVLINGAGGGVGTFAVQLAKSFGTEVTGVDSTDKLEMLPSIGADHVIDYTQEDFTENGQRYNLILDVVGHRSIFDYKRALSSNGIYVMVGGSMSRILQLIFLKPWIAITSRKKMHLLVAEPNKNLDFMKALLGSGKVAAVIDKFYKLIQVPDALRYFGEGQVKGKVVIIMVPDSV